MRFMPGDKVPHGTRPVTRSELVRDLRTLGVRPEGVLMVHTRMSAIGWVVGGADVVVMALLDGLGPEGTLMAYAGWDENPWKLDSWPEAWQRAYREPVLEDDRSVWRTYRDIDTSARGAFPYEEVLGPGVDPFTTIGREAAVTEVGRTGHVGDAGSYVFEAEPLVRFAVRWLEERFSQRQ